MRSSSSFLLLRGVSFLGFFVLVAFLPDCSEPSQVPLLPFLPRAYTWTDGFMNRGYDREVAELLLKLQIVLAVSPRLAGSGEEFLLDTTPGSKTISGCICQPFR